MILIFLGYVYINADRFIDLLNFSIELIVLLIGFISAGIVLRGLINYFLYRVFNVNLTLVESTGLEYEPERKDFRLIPVSGLKKAMEMGSSVVNNLIMLGVYTELAKPLSPELIEEELESRYGNKESVLDLNKKAFNVGLEMGKQIGTA